MLGHLVLWKLAFLAGTKAAVAIGGSAAELASLERRLARSLGFTPVFMPRSLAAGECGRADHGANRPQTRTVAVG